MRQFIEWTAEDLGLRLRWEGKGIEEVGTIDPSSPGLGAANPGVEAGKPVVRIDPRYFRPAEVETLLGDPTKAKSTLGWIPEIGTRELCREMIANDLDQARRVALLKLHGYNIPVSVE